MPKSGKDKKMSKKQRKAEQAERKRHKADTRGRRAADARAGRNLGETIQTEAEATEPALYEAVEAEAVEPHAHPSYAVRPGHDPVPLPPSSPDAPAAPALPQARGPRETLARLTGAKLVYGKAVSKGDYTVIPVASVRAAGGYGVGRGQHRTRDEDTEGGGGGGALVGRPSGFIEIGPHGARYEPIRNTAATVATAAAGVAVGAVAFLASRRGRRGLLRR